METILKEEPGFLPSTVLQSTTFKLFHRNLQNATPIISLMHYLKAFVNMDTNIIFCCF